MGVSSLRNVFLFVSFCYLWWSGICDSGYDHASNVPYNSEFQENDPIGGPNIPVFHEKTEHIHKEHAHSLGKKESSTSNDVHSPDVNIAELEKDSVDNHHVKIPKFGEPFKKARRRESEELVIRKRVKLTHSEPSVVEDRSVLPSEISNQKVQIEKEVYPESSPGAIGSSEQGDVESKIPGHIPIQKQAQHIEPSASKPAVTPQPSSPGSVEINDIPVGGDSAASSLPSPQTVEDASDHSHHHHPHSDAMPSFDEWKKMMLAEQQKGGHAVPPSGPPGKKLASQKRRRNYASYECGAKIVSSNSEGEGTSRILNELVDEYMLNPCKAKIWFVIELCESVQASQIELANFELFSSCPKDFAVYSSDNFPTRDWIPLGTFAAAEQRILQSFPLKQEGFGKFIKIELQSHYGKEHYCPLSVVRIFGTSMVDEYEEMETLQNHHVPPEDELDRLDLPVEDQSSSNLFGSATDAVYNIVKKAAQVLVQHKSAEDDDDKSAEKNASEAECKFINNSCFEKEKVNKVTATDFFFSATSMRRSLYQHLRNCDQCISVSRPSYYSFSHPQCRFFQAAFGPVLFNTICDWFKDNIITLENLPVVAVSDNTTVKATKSSSLPPTVISVIIEHNRSDTRSDAEKKTPTLPAGDGTVRDASKLSSSVKVVKTSHVIEGSEVVISPTKTQSSSENDSRSGHGGSVKTKMNVAPEDSEKNKIDPSVEYASPDSVSSSTVTVTTTIKETVPISQDDSSSVGTNVTKDSSDSIKAAESGKTENGSLEPESSVLDTVVASTTVVDSGLDEFSEDFRSADEKFADIRDASATAVVGSATLAQKESVFMRMSNRIKALELNMSLSSQYLQELSQRYRRQMEEMQRAFNRTIGTLNDTARKAAEKDMKQQEVISQLQAEVANLTQAVDKLMSERDATSRRMLEVHIFLMVVEAIIMVTIMSLCVRRISLLLTARVSAPVLHQSLISPVASHPDLKRRNSAETTPVSPAVKVQKRSVSEEVIQSDELVVIEPTVPVFKGPHVKVKKKHKKRKGMHRSASSPNMSPRKSTLSVNFKKKLSKDDNSAAAGIIFSHANGVLCKKPNHTCENCKGNIPCGVANSTLLNSKTKRLDCEPLKNLTNGKVENIAEAAAAVKKSSTGSLEKDRFNLKKFLRLQKRESI